MHDTVKKGHGFYEMTPMSLGMIVHGIDLSEDVPEEVIEAIKEDTTKYRMLVFKDQGKITGKRHIEIGKWFGVPDIPFDFHPKSPERGVFRLSNDIQEGLNNIGTAWHIDATFLRAPFGYSLYYMEKVPKDGPTLFCGLNEVVEQLPKETLDKWDRLYMISDRHERPIHPIIFSHPVTKKKLICFNSLMIEAFIWDYGSPDARITDPEETRELIKEIDSELDKENKRRYAHYWEEGEFVITDNLTLGHSASPESTQPKEKIGLRILHRVSTRGNYRPVKMYTLDTQKNGNNSSDNTNNTLLADIL